MSDETPGHLPPTEVEPHPRGDLGFPWWRFGCLIALLAVATAWVVTFSGPPESPSHSVVSTVELVILLINVLVLVFKPDGDRGFRRWYRARHDTSSA